METIWKLLSGLIDLKTPYAGAARVALDDWRRVEQAAQDLTRLGLSDATDGLLNRIMQDGNYTDVARDHPDVKAWSAASKVLADIANKPSLSNDKEKSS